MTKQALEGVKVIDLTWVLVGPTTSMYLADYGATVVHVESSIWMDILRQGPPFKDGVVGLNRSGWFNNYNRNKLGMTLNLKHPQGVEVFKKMVAWADVVVENFAAGVMVRMGLGYQDLARIKPDIIMLSTCMQGQTGPHATHPGYGVQMASLAGISQFMGWPDREPAIIYGAYTDSIVPRFAASAIVAALDYRRRTGKGQHLDLSQFETSLSFVAPAILDYTVNEKEGQRMGNRCVYAAPHGAYPCRGHDRWC
ncbi:MAG: CoA transferase, partial [Dehalococcoidia bacterium]|nr:CoA transferase [Dehalococcoidia bacterium]